MKMKQSSMRSAASLNQDIKMMKTVTKNPPVSKKKKSTKLNPPMRDTISETISFVIKGKLTPIKPILMRKEIDLINSKSKAKCQKNIKRTNRKTKKIKKIKEEPLKIKSKVQTKTAKNTSAQNIFKNKSDTVVVNIVTQPPKTNSKHSKLESKIINKRPKTKEEKPKKVKNNATADKTLKIKKVSKVTKKQCNKKKIDKPLQNKTVIDEDEIKKQQTIEQLLKEVNEEIKSKKIKPSKHKSSKTKKKNVLGQNKLKKNSDSDELSLTNQDSILQKHIKSELIESVEVPKSILPTNDIILESKLIKKEPESNEQKEEDQLPPSNKRYKKLKTKPKITMMKKRVVSKNKNKVDQQICKTKLFKFWNGPKRHRVASLNALAKVHCLYENETKGNILDIVDESSKLPYSLKRDTKYNKNNKIETPPIVKDGDNSDTSPTPTRILRSVPGLRAVGKHWDMHDTSSSDDEDLIKFAYLPVKVVKKEKSTQPKLKSKDDVPPPVERKRKPSEVVMDFKDMVVSKRMASLNASAILAASYSVEKRSNKSKDSNDDTSSCASNSSEEYFAALGKDIKEEEVDETKENVKLLEVPTTPNKNVAVILNQDTDVTITGVYVNSTTRSTHHEGFCSIAGMQYRISATSHTQTAATAVATETLLQSSSSSGPDNSNSDSMPSSKSYTPLDALSNMQPPPGPGIQHNHPVLHGQQHMGPPQHVLPLPPHQLSPGLRHGCSSAFSSPNSNQTYQIPSGHNPPIQGEGGFVHGYYQPAGPLISVPPTHCSSGQPPPPVVPPITKTVPPPDASPTTSTTPSLSSHEIPPPPPSSNGDSSDSEVIITSVTAAKDNVPSQSHASSPYRYPQYPSYQYSYPAPYSYPPAPLPPNPHPPYSHHDICYSNPYGHKWTYRRHLSGSQYYPPNPQEMYPVPHAVPSPQSQQMVTTTPVSASGTFSSPIVGPPPPPPTIMETYAGPLESYQPPQPPHFYPSPVYPPPGPCYSHQPTRSIPYLSTYQSNCPCPMQSCPKNVLTGPLTGDSKRSNMTSISNDSMPLPSIALVLPSEPASATGPPSPARGSAGMPPPPSPAGATYQPPPVATKQESHSPISEEDCKLDKKKKARIGKAMVRRNIAANMQQNTMLLMCNPVQDYVKREIESPQNIELEQKRDKNKLITQDLQNSSKEINNLEMRTPLELREEHNVENSKKVLENCKPLKEEIEDPLPPVINTVAENVKVKNMKRKLSMCSEKISDSESPLQKKKKKAGSYKYLIKKETNAFKINNGKLKLLGEIPSTLNSVVRTKTKLRRPTTKNNHSFNKESVIIRRKLYKQIPLNTLNGRSKSHRLTLESKIKNNSGLAKKGSLRQSTKSAPAVLDKLFAKNNVERIIESVIVETLRTSHESKTDKCIKQSKSSPVKTNVNNVSVPKKIMKTVTKKLSPTRRKLKHNEASTPQIPRAIKRSLSFPKWSNGWIWEGEPFESKVFLNSDELTVVRKCFPAMRHHGGDIIVPRDCVLLKAGPRKNDLPFVAKIASLWENPDDGEMMMSLLWYYRPEHTEQGRLPTDQSDEVFASRHKDSNSVACIDDKCYVLTFNEYCRYRKTTKRVEAGIEEVLPCIPNPEPYPRSHRQPPMTLISPEMVFFCRRVYDFRQKRIMKNPT